jgi:ankyrin repeat protein
MGLTVLSKKGVEMRSIRDYLLNACLEGDLEAVKQLVDNNDVDLVNTFYTDPEDAESETSYLLTACYQGNWEVAKFLIERGADPNSQTFMNPNPLWQAMAQGNTEMIGFLVQHGADINGNGSTSYLHCELSSPNLEMCQCLLDNGCDPLRPDVNGRTLIEKIDETVARIEDDVQQGYNDPDEFTEFKNQYIRLREMIEAHLGVQKE